MRQPELDDCRMDSYQISSGPHDCDGWGGFPLVVPSSSKSLPRTAIKFHVQFSKDPWVSSFGVVPFLESRRTNE